MYSKTELNLMTARYKFPKNATYEKFLLDFFVRNFFPSFNVKVDLNKNVAIMPRKSRI